MERSRCFFTRVAESEAVVGVVPCADDGVQGRQFGPRANGLRLATCAHTWRVQREPRRREFGGGFTAIRTSEVDFEWDSIPGTGTVVSIVPQLVASSGHEVEGWRARRVAARSLRKFSSADVLNEE